MSDYVTEHPTTDSPEVSRTSDSTGPLHGPRTRWAAVIWGLALAGIASGALWVMTAVERRDGFVDWLAALSPSAIAGYSVLTLGVLVLVAGGVGLVRRAQTRAIDNDSTTH